MDNQINFNLDIKKIGIDSKYDWKFKLNYFWTYQTIYKLFIRTIFFSLIYKIEAIILIEFKVSLLYITINKKIILLNL